MLKTVLLFFGWAFGQKWQHNLCQRIPLFPITNHYLLLHFWSLSTGVKVGLFTPGEAFEVVAKRRIAQLKEPATKIVGLVTEELRNIMVQGLTKVKTF